LDADKEYINLTDNPPSKRQKINEGMPFGRHALSLSNAACLPLATSVLLIGNSGTAATGYQTEFGLPAKTPENEPTLCPDLPSKGFVVNLVSNLRTEPGHLPVAGPKISHPLVQNLQGAKGPTKGPRPPFTTPGSGLVAWRQQFQRRLRYYKEKAGNLPNGRERPHQIVVEGEFGDDDPALAIASVWEGAMRWGVKYAFGTPYLFQIARQDPLLGVTCVGAPNALIMPLIFNAAVNNPPQEEENYVKPAPPPKSREQLSQEKEDLAKMDELAEELKDKGGHNHGNKPSATTAQQEAQRQQWVGGVGHFVLAVAEREPGSEDGVRMTYMNSALIPSMGVLRATARNVVRNSSWMPEGVWPRFTSEVRQPVPQQVGGSVCGTHVVLNAWAYMLNIPINATWSTSKDEESSFYMEARTVINLALQGHMDSETILSFLTSYGYARYQSLNHIPHRARGVQSVLINIDILGDMVDGMRREERSKGKMTNKASPKGLLSGHTTGPAPGGPGGSTNPPKVLPAPPKTDPLVLPPKGPTPGAPAGSINPPKIVAPTTDPQPPNTGTAPTGTLAGCAAPVKGVVPSQGTGKKLWTQRLVEGIRSYKAERRKLGKHNFHQVRELEEQLYDDDISCAIAAVWLFRCCRKPDDGHGLLSVGAPHPLIMPLLFNIDDQNDHYRTGRSRSNDGHLMLVVAERESDSTNNIRLKIMDSLPGFVNDNVIRTTAENIVRYSGWMGLTRAGTPVAVQPTFTVERIDVPQQTDAIRCGLNVIFNAWAYMLGIPITRNRSLKSESKTTDFYMFGRHIINSALNGCLNLQTIQALFNTHEYCQPQGLEVAIPSIRSVGMNPKVLHDIVEAIMADERLQAFGSGPPA